MLWPHFDNLCALSEYTRTSNWNLFVLYIVLILVIPHNIRNVFKNLHDLHAYNLIWGSLHHLCISLYTLDQLKHEFYLVHCIKYYCANLPSVYFLLFLGAVGRGAWGTTLRCREGVNTLGALPVLHIKANLYRMILSHAICLHHAYKMNHVVWI